LLLGFLAFALQACLLDFEGGAAVVAAAQFDDIPAEIAQGAEVAAGLVGQFAVPVREGGGVAGGQEGGQMISESLTSG
jgi:hypothetical protein